MWHAHQGKSCPNFQNLASPKPTVKKFVFQSWESPLSLQFEDFAVELNLGCIYDAVTIYCEEEENQLCEH